LKPNRSSCKSSSAAILISYFPGVVKYSLLYEVTIGSNHRVFLNCTERDRFEPVDEQGELIRAFSGRS
jgi:hypothetical protein